MRIDLVSGRKWLFLMSGVTALLALIVLAIPPALKPGIEFTSGSTMQLKFAGPVKVEDLQAEFTRLGHPEARIQSTGSSEFLIRTRSLQSPPGSYNEVEPTATATAAAAASGATS